MKNASLFLNFLKVFFKEKKKRSGCEEKIDKKRKNKERLSRAWCCAVICAEIWGQGDSFLHISGRKKSRSLGEENGPLSQSAADTVRCSRKTSGEKLFIYYIKPLTGQTADRPLPRANARAEQRGCRCIREALQRSMCSNRFCECAPDQRIKADRPF